jgi:hypothetical protein
MYYIHKKNNVNKKMTTKTKKNKLTFFKICVILNYVKLNRRFRWVLIPYLQHMMG